MLHTEKKRNFDLVLQAELMKLLTITDIWPLARMLAVDQNSLRLNSSTQNSADLPFVNDEMTFTSKLHVAETASVLCDKINPSVIYPEPRILRSLTSDVFMNNSDMLT